LNNSIISPRYLLYFNVGRCNAFNLSLYDFFDSSGINFVAQKYWTVYRIYS